jgi:membrane-associated protein
MDYAKFFFYNVVGGMLWVVLFIASGFFFGNLPAIKDNLSLVILIIIVISILPAIFEVIRLRGGGRIH